MSSYLQKIFTLIQEAVAAANSVIKPEDIYDLYYITYTLQMQPATLEDTFKKDVIQTSLERIKKRYLAEFISLFQKQLVKYLNRKRVDKGFSAASAQSNDLNELLTAMKQTYRSDMSRRNERWESIISHLIQLEKTQDITGIMSTLDRINNLTHNTETKVIDKLSNSSALLAAFDTAHKSRNPMMFRRFCSADVKQL